MMRILRALVVEAKRWWPPENPKDAEPLQMGSWIVRDVLRVAFWGGLVATTAGLYWQDLVAAETPTDFLFGAAILALYAWAIGQTVLALIRLWRVNAELMVRSEKGPLLPEHLRRAKRLLLSR